MTELQYEINQKQHMQQAGIGFVKGLISLIFPYSSPIIGAWEGYYASRLQETTDYLIKAVTKLGEDKIDKKFIESEEFMDLFIDAIHLRMRSGSKEKARFILGTIVESINKDRNKYFQTVDKEYFLSTVSSLTENEMLFLSDFLQGKYSKTSKADIYETNEDLALIVDCLLVKGILREADTWEKYLVESALGKKFIDYLKVLITADS